MKFPTATLAQVKFTAFWKIIQTKLTPANTKYSQASPSSILQFKCYVELFTH